MCRILMTVNQMSDPDGISLEELNVSTVEKTHKKKSQKNHKKKKSHKKKSQKKKNHKRCVSV